MNILVIGGGGREHAIAWRLAQSPLRNRIFAAPGNPGMAQLAECWPASSVDDYAALADALDIDVTIVGPEAPLVAGVVDQFRADGRAIFGPTAAAAQLEGSKAFSKDLMLRAGVPTARHVTASTGEEARRAVAEFGFPVVLKADGLAAGKGVVIARDQEEVDAALPGLLGTRLVVEEFLPGEEVSFIVMSDGKTVLALQPSQDHKTAYDNDRGPNTGGMGAYCDSGILTDEQTSHILDTIIKPTIAQMAVEKTPFTGFLYAGLMMTENGPKVLEFNARLGDPETQAIFHRISGDYLPVLVAAANGDLAGVSLEWNADPSACVVLAAHGYPGTVRSGDVIRGIPEAENEGTTVFQAGTRASQQGLLTAGGRVLGVTASGADLQSCLRRVYQGVERIHFDGMHYRTDIGAKGLRRKY